MAIIQGDKVKLNNGQLITPQVGGWYDGQQFVGGTLSNPGQINALSNQQGAGQQVSNEVIAQTNPANVAYVQQQQQKTGTVPVPTTPQQTTAGTATPAMSGQPVTPVTTQPTINVQSIYDSANNAPELLAAQSEIDVKQKAFDEANAIINDNPFYSEATRVGKANQLKQQFNAEMTRLQGKADKLKADAEIKVNLALKQYDINNQAYKDQLSLFNSLLDGGGLDNASASDIANYAKATGISTTIIENLIAKQKKEDIKTQVITTEDGVAIIDVNSGKVISKIPLNMKGNADTASETKTKNSEMVKAAAQAGESFADIMKTMTGSGLSATEIYNLYNASSIHGQVQIGTDKSNNQYTKEELQAMGINFPSAGAPTTTDELIKMKSAGLIK